MSTRPLKEPLLDEHILQVEPPLQPFVDAGWRSRPQLYPGRALSAEALLAEQRFRSLDAVLERSAHTPPAATSAAGTTPHNTAEEHLS